MALRPDFLVYSHRVGAGVVTPRITSGHRITSGGRGREIGARFLKLVFVLAARPFFRPTGAASFATRSHTSGLLAAFSGSHAGPGLGRGLRRRGRGAFWNVQERE